MAVITFHPLTDDDALKLGRYVEASLSASKVTFDKFGATLEIPEVRLPNLDAAGDVLRMLQRNGGTRG